MKFNSKEEYSFVEMKDLDPTSRKVLPSNVKKLKGGAKFQNGDTLFARITPCLQNGKICQVQGLSNNIGFGSTEFLVFRGKENVSDNDFVYYLSREPFVRQFAEANMIGTSGRQRVAKEAFQNLELELPPLPEQTQIANILSAIDDRIENNLAINKTLENMAMALYKHWFVDFGPFKDGEFVDSELGLIPEGWEVKSVKDFGDTITGKTPSKKFPEHFGDEMPFVTPTDFKNYGKHILNAKRSISKLGIEKHQRNVIPVNSIIVTCIGSDMGKVAISKVSCLTNQQINSLKCNNYHYMYCFFVYNYSLLKRLAGDGTTMPIINKSTFEAIEVLYPGEVNLNNFECQLNEFDEQILINSQENQTLTKLRDTLLPKLISGEIRLKEFRAQVENLV
ncbi:restriction modification system DNA specificity domain-containing protein [Cellulophaga geojensis KL-A]|uniref:Restriction modification system DNA specificity domain-containing protein n=1 Tax=Cellulophaga geojensis KL-A TaxID=1328323 RepID=A0ABN0RJL0_9FLAO|nr:restriction endonuclease subunit S [Cellulophaga geojensis]EWH10565.1 restriction modification system DNA specificity domain-containing protein [Cellulophaga geojensis KL-A]